MRHTTHSSMGASALTLLLFAVACATTTRPAPAPPATPPSSKPTGTATNPAGTPANPPATGSSPAPADRQEVERAPAEARALVNPVAATPDALQRGEGLFQRHCVVCHGPQGRGDGPIARQWAWTPKNLTDPELQTRLADGEIYWQITHGHWKGSDEIMPSFRDRMSEKDRWRVVLYVRSLGARH